MKLNDIQKVLHESDLIWWLDSGSLLGLVRDGKFLEQDKDIDIGVLLEQNEDQISEMIDAFSRMGFRVVTFKKNGVMFKCKLIPKNKEKFKYTLDIQFYLKQREFYVCPQMIQKRNLSFIQKVAVKYIKWKKTNPKNYSCKNFRGVINYLGSTMFNRRKTNIDFGTGRQNLFDVYLWSVPVEYMESFVLLEGFNIFEKVEKYLEYRYGTWKTPVTQWSFLRDDGGIRPASDGELEEILQRKSL